MAAASAALREAPHAATAGFPASGADPADENDAADADAADAQESDAGFPPDADDDHESAGFETGGLTPKDSAVGDDPCADNGHYTVGRATLPTPGASHARPLPTRRPASPPVTPGRRVGRMAGVPIPRDWPEVVPNGKVRAPAAVETARSLISPSPAAPSSRTEQADFGSEKTARSRESRLIDGQSPPKERVRAAMVPPHHQGAVMPQARKPSAVEAVRASLASQSRNKVVFAECHDDPVPIPPPGSGGKRVPTKPKNARPRNLPPKALRDAMPEHSDAAYYAAQAALREPAETGILTDQEVVGPSDYHRGGPRLHVDELKEIVDLYTAKYGPILSLAEAARVTKFAPQTLRRYVSEGKFATSVYRGKPLRFVTARLIEEVLG